MHTRFCNIICHAVFPAYVSQEEPTIPEEILDAVRKELLSEMGDGRQFQAQALFGGRGM